MALKKLLNRGTVYKRSDGRWGGAVRYRDENGALRHRQAAVYMFMLNIGLRTGEALGLLNSDIDLKKREMSVVRAAKEVSKLFLFPYALNGRDEDRIILRQEKQLKNKEQLRIQQISTKGKER